MAIDYTPVMKNFIVNPYMELLKTEFAPIPVNMKDPEGKNSFSIISAKDNIIGLVTGPGGATGASGGGWKADYEIKTIYDYVAGGNDKELINFELMEIAERARKLIDNWRDFTVPLNWIDAYDGTWGTSTFVWVESQSKYCWTRGRIEEIDLEQPGDLKQNHYQVSMNFKCFREHINVN